MLVPDQQIGRYRISSAIGAGGMGEVYLARDEALERSVALKILPADIADDAERVQRFIQEAKAVSALNHPNILTIHEIGSENGTRFIASEYVEGQTLRKIIDQGELELKEVLEISVQIASALETAHRKNIVHRDIKPANVMVRDDGLVKVLDFGLAKLLKVTGEVIDTEAATKARVMTQFGMILGTVSYMSPEQTRGVAAIDGRTDIWSLGVVIFEMLTQRRPFEGESSTDTMASILKTEAPRLSEFCEDCPPELERIVQKSLQKNRDERYQVVRDMALDLKSLGKDLDSSARLFRSTGAFHKSSTSEYERNPADTGSQIHDTAAQAASRSPVFAFLSAALAIGLLAVLGIWYFAPFGRSQEASPASALKTTEIVSWASSPGEIYSIGSFSPDGKMIAFSSTKTGTKNIWIKQTTSGEAIQITKDEFKNEQPIWSPNGEELAFYSTRGDHEGFWRIPVLGGSPKLISAIDDGSSRLRYWSKNGLIYYESNGELASIDVSSGQTKPFTDLASKGVKGASSLSLSPDENNIAYKTTEGEISSVWTTNVKGEVAKQLLSSAAEIKNIAWHPDSKRLFYSASTDGTFQIFVTDIYGTDPRQLTFSDDDSLVLDVSSDGTRILYGSAKEESDIWGVSLKDNKEFIVASDIDSELWPDVSPNGKTLAYQSIKNLSQGNKLFSGDILTKGLGTDEQPVELVKNGGLPKWSPDGKSLAFLRVIGNNHQIETINSTGGESKQLTVEGVSSVSNSILPYNRIQTNDFSWSPDGSKIAYVSSRKGRSNIWIIGADGSNDVQLSNSADSNLYQFCPLWSLDGKRIAFTTTHNLGEKPTYSLSVIDTETKNSDPIATGNSFIRIIEWSQSGNELILVSVSGSSVSLPPEVSVLNVETVTGRMSYITKLKDAYLFNIHLSPDKKTIAFAAHRESQDNIWVMPATGGEAKRITNNNDSRLYFSSLAWSPDGGSIFFGKQSRYSLLSMLTNFN